MCKEDTGSVYFDGSVDLAEEKVGSVKANGAGEQPEGEDHHKSVAKVQKRWNELCDLQLSHEVEDSIGKDIQCRASGHT